MTQLTSVRTPSPAIVSRPPRAVIGVGWAWAALFFNVLAFLETPTLLPIPGIVGQLLTQGALPAALVFALLANPRGLVKPAFVLMVLSTVAVLGLMVSIHNEFMLGSTFRAIRFLGFVVVLWLLTPWWGRRDLALLRVHRICLSVVLVLVVVGAVAAPGMAFDGDNRLNGVIWPILPTQVAHYAAVMLGSTILLWVCHSLRGRTALAWALVSVAVLIGTHTRTAVIALIAGLLCALASLFLSHTRVRRTFLWGGIAVTLGVLMFAGEIRAWALRGQTAQEAGQLTGRTHVWTEVLHAPRPWYQEWFGSGLSNLSWNGLAIDSTWVGTYMDAGIVGVALVALLIILLLFQALTDLPGPGRAIAIFLVVYCLFASVTETGLGAPSPYILDLTVAASLLGSSRGEWR